MAGEYTIDTFGFRRGDLAVEIENVTNNETGDSYQNRWLWLQPVDLPVPIKLLASCPSYMGDGSPRWTDDGVVWRDGTA